MNDRKLYLKMKERVLEQMDFNRELSDGEVVECIEKELSRADKTEILSFEKRKTNSRNMFYSFRKFGILQELLEDEEVTEIMVNGAEKKKNKKKGELYSYGRHFADQEELEDLIQTICAGANRMVNEASPIVDARLPEGSRVNIVLKPLSLDGSAVSIRKFSQKPMSMEKLLEYQSLSKEIVEFLEKLVKAGYNIFVSGGTGTGKTTFLNALSQFIPREERVITIEDSAELQLNGILNLVRLETRQAGFEGVTPIGIRDLIRTALRMRADRLIVGECRGAEAVDLLSANNTGHSGSLGTGHANSAKDMLSRLETMVLMGMDIPIWAVRGQILSGIDVIIHLGRLRDKSRKLLEIAELSGMEDGEIVLNSLYQFKEAGEKEGRIQGIWVKTGELLHREKWENAGFGI